MAPSVEHEVVLFAGHAPGPVAIGFIEAAGAPIAGRGPKWAGEAVQEAPVRIGLIEVKISMEAIVAYSTEMAGGAFQENFKIVTICSSSSPSSLFSERSNIFDAVQARDVPL